MMIGYSIMEHGGCFFIDVLFLFLGQLVSMTPEQMQAYRWEREIDERNRPLGDEELDALFPKEGYKVCLDNNQ